MEPPALRRLRIFIPLQASFLTNRNLKTRRRTAELLDGAKKAVDEDNYFDLAKLLAVRGYPVYQLNE